MNKSLIFLLLSASLLHATRSESGESVIKLDEERAQHIGIRTLKPAMTHSMPLARAPARVSLPPQNEYVVSAAQAGLISKVEVAIGIRVTAGQVLAQMQSPDLVNLQRSLLDTSTQFNLAQAKRNRDHRLLNEGIISSMRWQETQSEYERASSALHGAEQVLAAAGASVDDIRRIKQKRQLSSTLLVRSPFTGVVLERMALAGQRVDMLTPLFRIGKLDELWLEIDMPTERVGEAVLGDYVFIDNSTIKARITHISQNVSPGNQSALVRALIEGKAENVRPGQNVNVQLMHNSTDQLFRLPSTALLSQAGQDYVFVRVAEGYAPRHVEVASREDREVIIHGGLNAGDEVAVQGVAALKASWIGMDNADEGNKE